MEFDKSFSLPTVLGAESSAAEDENHWVLSLQFGELPMFRGVIGKLIVGEDCPWNNVRSHIQPPFLLEHDLPSEWQWPQRIRSDFAACRLATSMSILPKLEKQRKAGNLARSCVLRATLLPKTVGCVSLRRHCDLLNPLAPPSGRLEGIREILCLVHDLSVAELHNTHCVGWSPLVRDGVFRDPEITVSENSLDVEA
jgi:hypothetical protein